MIEGRDPVLQAFLGTLMTWGLTAAGAAMAFFIKGNQVSYIEFVYLVAFTFSTPKSIDIISSTLYTYFQRKLLDASLGFAGGVMLAASYWSLLEPAIEMARTSTVYGSEGR